MFLVIFGCSTLLNTASEFFAFAVLQIFFKFIVFKKLFRVNKILSVYLIPKLKFS